MADDVPTIEQIVDGLIGGEITKERAIKWIEEHVDTVANNAADSVFYHYEENN